MRKVSIIAMAALTLLTAQCKKNEPKPEEKVMVPITGSVDFGGSKTEITTAGYITPVTGDKIYIYHEGDYAGYMTCTLTTGQQFICSGEIEGDCLGETCTFMYLGSNNDVDGENDTEISFADQTGVSVSGNKISGLDKFHVGSCQAKVSADGKVTLPMVSKMAIAHFQLTDGANPIANENVTISGVSALAHIDNIEGTISGDGTGTITVRTDAQGKFYMALIPQSDEVNFIFSGPCNGTQKFLNGIRECNFYSYQGSGNPLQVTVTVPLYLPGEFTVSPDVKVKFSRGNLWYGIAAGESTPAFRFEANQWDFRHYSGIDDDVAFIGGVPQATPDGTVGSFFWSETASVAYAKNYNESGTSTSDKFFTNDTETTANTAFTVNGESGVWRTLSIAEWGYLLGFDPEQQEQTGNYGRPGASDRWAWKKLSHNHVTIDGLVILPDDTEDPEIVMESIESTADLATHGAVFLPAAGVRVDGEEAEVYFNHRSFYWSSTPGENGEDGEGHAYYMLSDNYSKYYGNQKYGQWGQGFVYLDEDFRSAGLAVRLVR